MNNLNDNIYTQNQSINIRKGDGGYSQYDPKSDVLIDKTFTDNGIYTPTADGVDGFKDITVDVNGQPDFTQISTYYELSGSGALKQANKLFIFRSKTGEYTITETITQYNCTIILADPVKAFKGIAYAGDSPSIIFTPRDDYMGFYSTINSSKPYTLDGSEVVPGDGITYNAFFNKGPGIYTMSKADIGDPYFSFSII